MTNGLRTIQQLLTQKANDLKGLSTNEIPIKKKFRRNYQII